MVEGLVRRLYFPFWDAEGLDEMAVLAFWLAIALLGLMSSTLSPRYVHRGWRGVGLEVRTISFATGAHVRENLRASQASGQDPTECIL